MNDKLQEAINSSLISDQNFKNQYEHEVLINSAKSKIITTIKSLLLDCDEFLFSVAFITHDGIVSLLNELHILNEKNIPGKIITGTYLNFTEPKALKLLQDFPNIEVKVMEEDNLHSKGFFFRKEDIWSMVIGSSNLTRSALTTNMELNIKFSGRENGKVIKELLNHFNYSLLISSPLKDVLDKYTATYYKIEYDKVEEIVINKEITPNEMQIEALDNLTKLRLKGEDKALLIAATGTGKTYLSAFDVKSINPKSCLFIVHRANIMSAAKKSFESIIKDKKMGIYSGGNFEECDYMFTTIQTLHRENHLLKFLKNQFEYIIIDEVHHAGAETYQKVVSYFEPKFLLGMTATPERGDSFDIFKLFNNNIASEIRLSSALEMNILCPFSYFGVVDIENISDDKKTTINQLTSDERVNHILNNSNKYGYSGDKRHGLIFVSRVDEALELAKKINLAGVKCECLNGDDAPDYREEVISKLENGEIEFIITVDIFNEGIDIPCINQVLLLRATKSSIVYIQQIGRGLRRNGNKKYVTIIDFIGNYKTNFLIPIALGENNTSSFDKDDMNQFIKQANDLIPGECVIDFEPIAAQRIFENIETSNFTDTKLIKSNIEYLEKKIGRLPLLVDMYEQKSISPAIVLNKYKSQYDLLSKIKKIDYNFDLDDQLILEYLSSKTRFSTRIHEMFILQELLEFTSITLNELVIKLEQKYDLINQKDSLLNAITQLTLEANPKYSNDNKYVPIIKSENGIITFSNQTLKSMEKELFCIFFEDIIRFNIKYCSAKYAPSMNKAVIYSKYNRIKIFKDFNMEYHAGKCKGYETNEDGSICIVFGSIGDTQNFANKLISTDKFIYMSQKNKKLFDKKNMPTLEWKIANGEIETHVLIEKNGSGEFYYMGQVDSVKVNNENLVVVGEKGNYTVIEFEFTFENKIPSHLYKYMKQNVFLDNSN